MYTHCLLVVALILAAFPSATQQHRGAAPMRGVTIVERLRSELLSVIDIEVGAEKDVSLPAGRFDPDLTRLGGAPAAYAESGGDLYSAKRAAAKPAGLPGLQPALRRGSSCWWLWLLSGVDVCW